ncbi:hypothetical protein BT96DRAFT_962695 [Gymnopus androsaceus JB14]|uniref:N-acetyltransferase domain-containing protein n=1 Tax=Gymnopus androsaceus JB14 TaxID=1447944 RepID=A0A6A4II92_9AGAR|nr:hypothetical protein BT96DRAFT_962695 [Gymnopus androsaceus JB14]
MPSAVGFSISSFRYPNALPDNALRALEENRIDANVILPLARTLIDNNSHLPPTQLWLCCISFCGTVEMVLSCTENEMGKYPIFIVPTRPLSRNSLRARLRCLAETLHAATSLERVYSVFAPVDIASLFSQQWSDISGVAVEKEPYYAARLLSCTALTAVPDTPFPQSGSSRLADVSDTEAVARLCAGFSQESPPFVLKWEDALKEADILISKRQVWLHSIFIKGRPEPEVACIVAFTRNTVETATITKVYTAPSCRRRGYAKELVREVCLNLLQTPGRREVVLYVSHGNKSAAKVYESVGFVEPDTAVESGHSLNWSELGFDVNKVELGHW